MTIDLPRDFASFPDELPRLLGALRYPGFEHLAGPDEIANPANVVLTAIRSPIVPARVIEALPWVLVTYIDLAWGLLIDQAQVSGAQNRLGFLVSLARQVAEQQGQSAVSAKLRTFEDALDKVRLPNESTLGQALTEVERANLRKHRSASAEQWNLLTSLRVEDLRWANAGPSAAGPPV